MCIRDRSYIAGGGAGDVGLADVGVAFRRLQRQLFPELVVGNGVVAEMAGVGQKRVEVARILLGALLAAPLDAIGPIFVPGGNGGAAVPVAVTEVGGGDPVTGDALQRGAVVDRVVQAGEPQAGA